MGKFLIGFLGLIAGLVVGAVLGGSLIGGAATGVGIATGLSAGICSTVMAASAEDLLGDEQIDQLLTRATTELGGTVESGQLVGSVAQCAEVMENLRTAAAE